MYIKTIDYMTVSFDYDQNGVKYLASLGLGQNRKNSVIDLNDYEEFADLKKIGSGNSIWDITNPHIEKLVLPRGVEEIRRQAFWGICADVVVWPDNCRIIPEEAFSHSTVCEIQNIDNVLSIGEFAFRSSRIKSFVVPSAVDEIPRGCFSKTPISDVLGTEHIKTIKSSAFSYCVSLKTLSNLNHLMVIEKYAFFLSGINTIDLSQSVCCTIEEGAFSTSKLKEVIPGYFMTGIDHAAFFNTPFEKEAWKIC